MYIVVKKDQTSLFEGIIQKTKNLTTSVNKKWETEVVYLVFSKPRQKLKR